MDGGVRQGTDVLKALAMGAKAVFIGRPVLWGLAYKVGEEHCTLCCVMCPCPLPQGEEGVAQVLQILKDELKVAMMLSGRILPCSAGCMVLTSHQPVCVCQRVCCVCIQAAPVCKQSSQN